MNNLYMVIGFGGMYEESWDFELVVFGRENAEKLYESKLPDVDADYDEWTDLYRLHMYKAVVDEHGIVVPVLEEPIREFVRQ